MDHQRQQAVESGNIDISESEPEEFGVENDISAKDLGGTSVSTIDTDSVKSEDQDKKGIPEYQKQLVLLKLKELTLRRTRKMRESGVPCAQEKCMKLIFDAPCFLSLHS